MTTHPSQFAASLNQIEFLINLPIPLVQLLRYIPDVKKNSLRFIRQRRLVVWFVAKVGIGQTYSQESQIVLPLIFSSLERIDTISTAMELRRFGRYKKRTWYVHKSLMKQDYLVIVSYSFIGD